MGQPGTSPLVGYNTNVRHKGKLYHIQTEDSGVNHPHVITHLFADGGRIIASRKSAYEEHLGSDKLAAIVKNLMREQHKAVFIELRDCVYDEDEAPPEKALDVEALERAAEAHIAESAAAKARPDAPPPAHYEGTVPTHRPSNTPIIDTSTQMLTGKSLDEVILSYLSDDGGETEAG